MVARNQVYKCSVCGNIVELLHAGGGELVCCGKPMELLKEKAEDLGKEKHLPVIEKTDKGINPVREFPSFTAKNLYETELEKLPAFSNGVKVKVGSVPHPMEEKHYIEWIDISADGRVYRKFLKPNDKPEAEFDISGFEKIEAREYCILHGLWKA